MRLLSSSCKIRGYAYTEVLTAAFVLAIALVPMADSLRELADHAENKRELTQQNYNALALLETVLTEPFLDLEAEALATGGVTESTYSDAAAATYRRVVWVRPHDIDNLDADNDPLTGTDTGVVLVRVEIASLGIAFEQIVGEFS